MNRVRLCSVRAQCRWSAAETGDSVEGWGRWWRELVVCGSNRNCQSASWNRRQSRSWRCTHCLTRSRRQGLPIQRASEESKEERGADGVGEIERRNRRSCLWSATEACGSGAARRVACVAVAVGAGVVRDAQSNNVGVRGRSERPREGEGLAGGEMAMDGERWSVDGRMSRQGIQVVSSRAARCAAAPTLPAACMYHEGTSAGQEWVCQRGRTVTPVVKIAYQHTSQGAKGGGRPRAAGQPGSRWSGRPLAATSVNLHPLWPSGLVAICC